MRNGTTLKKKPPTIMSTQRNTGTSIHQPNKNNPTAVCSRRRRLFPGDVITDSNDSAFQHPRKHPASPVSTQRSSQAGSRFIHPFAGCQLSADLDASRSDDEDSSACVCQVNPADQ